MKNLHLITLALAALAISCGTAKTASSRSYIDLETTSWQVEELNGRALEAQGDSFTLLFNADGAMNGKGACNIMFGQYTQGSDGELSISPKGLTRTACPDMGIEREYIEMLEAVTSYSLSGGKLLLFSDENVAATLIEQQ